MKFDNKLEKQDIQTLTIIGWGLFLFSVVVIIVYLLMLGAINV